MKSVRDQFNDKFVIQSINYSVAYTRGRSVKRRVFLESFPYRISR